jgi:hypothetical protein
MLVLDRVVQQFTLEIILSIGYRTFLVTESYAGDYGLIYHL